ncbi:MAG: SpoIID/LytB domain-containing protein [Bdellovibrionales bacterium]|nr:SpoIID/LytB domain-containing protein [Bdellovibrionales bacterium]
MKEVPPESLRPPLREPRLRVGVVLEGDAVSQLTLEIPTDGYRLEAGSELFPGALMVRFHDERQMQVHDETRKSIFSGESLCIVPPPSQTLAPRSGIKVSPVIAGRSFHWKKEIAPFLPGTIEIHAREGSLLLVNELSFEQYLACVVSSEMSAACPEEFVKAQAIAARSWAFVFLRNKHNHPLYTICNDDDCQRYQGTTHLQDKTLKSLKDCSGEFLLDEAGSVVPAYYSKSCGGKSEDDSNVFGFRAPGNTSVVDSSIPIPLNLADDSQFTEFLNSPGERFREYCGEQFVSSKMLPHYLGAVDEAVDYCRWHYELSADRLLDKLKTTFGYSCPIKLLGLKPGTRGPSGRYLYFSIFFRNDDHDVVHLLANQYEIRRAFHESFLYSSAFTFRTEKNNDGAISKIYFSGTGWGHGVGLCQIGALGMALDGVKAHEILKHYFSNVSIVKTY